MDRSVSFISTISWTLETKSDIITYAFGNPTNKVKAKLSQTNEDLLGSDIANLFVKRHYDELQRCSQFYSLASIFNETLTKDKHPIKWNNIKKKHSTGRKYFRRLFRCVL